MRLPILHFQFSILHSHGDGLADGADPAPNVSCGAAFGQSSAWIAATFTNSSDIISMGYDDYLMSRTSGDDGDRRYIFYVELEGVGQNGGEGAHGPNEVLVSVGGQHVVANTNGTYGFLLNVGPEYQFGVSPPCAACFSASRTEALVSLNAGGMSGTVALRPTGVAVVPGDQCCYGSGEIHEFCTTGTIHAAAVSSAPGDIVLEAELLQDGGGYAYCVANSTAVALDSVAVAGAPTSGLVVLAESAVPMSAACVPAGANLDDAECDWYVGRRTKSGGHEGWVKIGDDIPGDTFSPTMGTGGIYRVKVEMTLCGATRETYYKIASRDNLDPPGGHYQVGGYDHIGVASEQWQITLRNTALSHLGSTAFAKESFLPSYFGFTEVETGYWKCNAFVAYCICQSNLAVPAKTSLIHSRTYPPAANVWASKSIKWWEKASADSIEPGFVVGHPASVGHGHCGIVDYDGFAIGAGEFSVNRKFTGFLDGSCGFNKYGGQ